MSLVIRDATPEDSGLILTLIRGLAEYERLADEVEADEDLVRASLFAPEPRVFCCIAEIDGKPAGFALWFYTYSTFLARHGIWLEDLFVFPELRGKGIGKALLGALAKRCIDENLGRLEWAVLDWNEPSIRFYDSLGAAPVKEWIRYRLDGEPMQRLALGPVDVPHQAC